MGIISTFDPKFKKQFLEKSVQEYGQENVVLIKKSHLFFAVKVLLPFILWFLMLIAIVTCSIIYIDIVWLKVSICIVAFLVFAFPWSKILKHFLDYRMDFAIITPKSFLRYNQTWFFKRSSKVIDLKHIRSVYVKKAGFFNSIFNNGNIIVLSEWSTNPSVEDGYKNSPWEVEFKYVYNPDFYSEHIQRLLSEINFDSD